MFFLQCIERQVMMKEVKKDKIVANVKQNISVIYILQW